MSVSGTVIQRSFIGRNSPNVINIATAPLDELGVDGENIKDIVSVLLGVPRTSILNDDEYDYFLRIARRVPEHLLFPTQVPSPILRVQAERIRDSMRAEAAPAERFSHFLALVGGASANAAIASNLSYYLEDRFDSNSEILTLATTCIAGRLSVSKINLEFYSDLFEYDIPLGQSPEVKSDSLLQLLETSKKYCLAPLAVGGAQAVTQLSQGNYVAALLTTGTAGAMTIVLIGTVAVGAMIVQRVAQVRGRTVGTSSEPPPPIPAPPAPSAGSVSVPRPKLA